MTSFIADSIDDLMNEALAALLDGGDRIQPTRGSAVELRGVRLELTNPRVRLSRSHTRGKPFSCLGELVWYLAGSGDAAHIAFYVPTYAQEAESDGSVHAAYGTRLLGTANRLLAAIETLRTKRDSRQAVVPLLDADDLTRAKGHVPCTSSLQFLLRDGRVDMVVSMRSNDAYLGLPHDVFAFTMLQEIVARSVGAEVGTYVHFVASLHLYDEHVTRARTFLAEGFTVAKPMPPMPLGSPWASIELLVAAEEAIRHGQKVEGEQLLDPYWADLVRLLTLYALTKQSGSEEHVMAVRTSVANQEVFGVFLNDRFGLPEH